MKNLGEVIDLRHEFGYDIPSEHTGEYWAISAHPNGVSYVKNVEVCWFSSTELYKDEPELFEIPRLVFLFLC